MRLNIFRWLACLLIAPVAILGTAVASNYSVSPGAVSITQVSLKEAILFAFDRDPSVGRQAAQMGIGEAQIDEAKSAWMPQISLSGNTGRNRTTDSSGSLKNSAAWGMSLTQLVYDFGKTNNAIKQSKAQHESYRYDLMATLTEVAAKTALNYVEVLRYSALVKAAQANILALKNVQQLAKLRADAGLSSTSDELQTQTRVAGMQATLEQYESALRSSRAKLSVLTGIDSEKFLPLPASMKIEQDSLDNIDYSLVPAVLAAQSMEKSADFAIQKTESQHWPTLSLRGGRTRYQSNNGSYWDDQIQLNVEAPLYQGGAVSARVQQAQGAKTMAATQVDQARFDVLQKASVAMADWSGALGREKAGRLQLETALRARDVYKNEYTLSKRSINDLLSVEQDVWQATSSKIIAEYDSWSAAINYEAALDNLLPAVGVDKNAGARLPDLG